ncbi:MAG: hypothetical protein JSU83_05205 [Deltaproteobacteria bacterium]|nr:MAG: hypothetical protein JSU83_05205 [Deltaproteobacteria bacterium]
MLKLLVIIGLLVVTACLFVAYAYLMSVSRENELPGLEDVEIPQEEK